MAYSWLVRLERLLKSREIFSNWAALGLKYLLYGRHLLRVDMLTARCRDGGSIRLHPRAYVAIVRLHAAKLLNRLDCRSGEVSACSVDLTIDQLGSELYWLSIHELCHALREGIASGRVRRENNIWIIDDVRFRRLVSSIIGVFLTNFWPLEGLDLRNREVLDVGAYVGDTSLYFLKHGAKRVVAVEPHPLAFREMLENIELNNAKDKIVAINAAIGSYRGLTKIPIDISLLEIAGMDALRSNNRVGRYTEVPIITLEDAMSHLGDPYMIKIHCGGCEYHILKNSLNSLKKFEVVSLRYHKRYGKIIVEKLRDLYRCRRNYISYSPPKHITILCMKS